MHKKTITITILLIAILIGILLQNNRSVSGSQEPAARTFLPMVADLRALTPFLVRDINTKTPSSFIYCPVFLGDKMLCSATDAEHGYELWQSNGQPGGASLVKDIAPNYDSYALHRHRLFAKLGDIVLFSADAGGFELWRTNGSKDGTVRLKGDFLEMESEEPFTVAGDLVYFLANDGQHGFELWRSDGTAGGTRLVKDIWPGPGNMGIYQLTPQGQKLYFIVEGDDYTTLWATNGTDAGTNQVAATADGPVTNIAALDDALLLNMRRLPEEGFSLWRTDGTAAGTERLSDYAGFAGLDMSDMVTLAGQIIFTFRYDDYARWGVGTSDGSSAGTQLVDGPDGTVSGPLNLIAAGSQAFFFAEFNQGEMRTLWRTDGTAAGTISLGQFKAADLTFCDGYKVNGPTLYFAADDGTHGCELWISDGTPTGTHMTADIAPGQKGSEPHPGVWFNGQFYFSATDALGDAELWRTDGTTAGTLRADDVHDFPSASSHPNHLIAQPKGLFLSARTGSEIGLWRSDGRKTGTTLVQSFGSDSIANPLHSAEWVMAGGRLYLITESPSAVWRSDGTPAGTEQLNGPEECGSPYRLAPVGDAVYFFAQARGHWLCRAGSTHEAIKYVGERVDDVLPAASLLYFRLGEKLGLSDGTAAGTKIFNAPVLSNGPIYTMAALGDTLYFNGCAGSMQDCELWKLDGPQSAPERVADLAVGPAGGNPYGLVAFNNRVIFTAVGATYGPLLWSSDGTDMGTWPFAEAKMCTGSSGVETAVAGDQLYFYGVDSQMGIESPNGCELWMSDGRFQGTRLVKDIWPGPNSASLAELTAVGERLIFTAEDPQHGRQLWISDGSGPGTQLLPGNGASSPGQLAYSDGKLYFSANNSRYGHELWALLP